MRGNMKIFKYALLIVFVTVVGLSAQDISFQPHNTFLYDVPGTEIIFEVDVTNLTNEAQTVFLVRTVNNLPSGWTSSLCFDLCFSPEVDSIATTSDYGSTPLAPNETRVVSLHVFTDNAIETANVQLQAGTFNNPNNRITVDFIATTDPSVGVEDESKPGNYFLEQNYPNPFNPSTQISYGVKEGGFVSLKVYNILGSEIATLVNDFKSAGNYIVDFKGANLSSGVYLYRLSVNNFVQTRKMILEK